MSANPGVLSSRLVAKKVAFNGRKNNLSWGDSGGHGHWAFGSSCVGGRRRAAENRIRRQPFSVCFEYFSGSRGDAFAERTSTAGHEAGVISLSALAERSVHRVWGDYREGEVGCGRFHHEERTHPQKPRVGHPKKRTSRRDPSGRIPPLRMTGVPGGSPAVQKAKSRSLAHI